MSKLCLLGFVLLGSTVLLRGQSSQPPVPGALKQPSQKRYAQSAGDQQQPKEDLKGTQASPLWVNVNCPGCAKTNSTEGINKSNEKPSQRRRADPNWWIVCLTGVLVLIAAIQAGFFFYQLRLMNKGLIESKIAAEAAKVAAEAAMNSAEIATNSERAWVVDEIRQVENLPNTSEAFAAYLTFKNFGRIPALVMGLKIRFLTFRFEETDPLVGGEPLPEFPNYDDEQIFLEIGDRGVILAPNQSLTVAQPFEEESGRWTDFLQIVVPTGQRRLCCYGLISYLDGFGILRKNQFCYIWDSGYDPKKVIPNFRRFGPSNYNHAT